MTLTIITINLNNKTGLENTIKSVVSQSFNNFEWIIIDGNSDDGSKEIIQNYRKYITIWKSEPDNGIYDAMNKGIKYATGQYLLFLNSGDILTSADCLQKIIPMLKEKDFYVGYELSENGRRGIKSTARLYLDYFLIVASLPHQSTFIKRETMVKYGLYNSNLTIVSDWWFSFKALVTGNATIEIIDMDVCYHDLQGISHTRIDIASQERIELLDAIKLPIIPCLFYNIYKFNHWLIPIKVKSYSFFHNNHY